MTRVAFISVHGCPKAHPGERGSGGMNVCLHELARELGQLGIRVDVFTRFHNGASRQVEELAENVRVVHLAAGDEEEKIKEILYCHLPQFLCQLLRFADDGGRAAYDLVHSHYWLSGWVGNELRSRWGVPHVATFHTLGETKNRAHGEVSETELRTATEREIVALADRVVATSDQERENLVRFYEAASDRIDVIPCGVDLEIFRPRDKRRARRALGLPADSRLALFVGRIDPVKGIDLLLRSVASLEDRDGLRVLVVGGDQEGRELKELRRLAWQLEIGERVTFTGAVERRQLHLYYNAADVCVIPSYYESFGMVALEALASGTPVIASRVGGLESTVRDGETGYLVPGHCPEPLAERLELLLHNDALRRAFGDAARRSVESFTWPQMAARVAEVYESVLTSLPALA